MMTVNLVKEKLGLKQLTFSGENEREVTGCYIGDLLSWVMGRAQSGDAWLTIMGNINSIAVAALADVACIILTENAALDEAARAKAEQQEILIFQTEDNSYQLALKISEFLK
ncbi:MAG: hypothetical protein LBM65_00685 [Oscillospiraceae bacterium]|nr:hypothetical protein [Oscillospiraceae bacterium]